MSAQFTDKALAEQGHEFEASALAALFGAGGVLGLLAMVVDHGRGVNAVGWSINSALGLLAALVLAVLADRVPTWVLHALILTGSAMVSLAMVFGHGGAVSVAASFFYVWVAVYVCWFFTRRAAVAHLVSASFVLAAVMTQQHTPAAPAVWLLVMGTAAVVGAVVSLMRQQLIAATTIDTLTGLPTRHVFTTIFTREVARARRKGTPLCVAAIDLDGLKIINDRDGHLAGDRTLADAARAWRGALRAEDLLVRFGGDEFVAVLPACDQRTATEVIARLRASTDAAWSVGLAWWSDGDELDDVLARADRELYRAKRGIDSDPPVEARPVRAAS